MLPQSQFSVNNLGNFVDEINKNGGFVDMRPTARTCLALGLSVVSIKFDGTKAPRGKWKERQRERMREEEIATAFPPGYGIALIGGAVSGNLEILDCDLWEVWLAFEQLARASGCGELLTRMMAGYFEKTPKGAHLPYRCMEIGGNQKLAKTYDRDEAGTILTDEHGKPLVKTLIETKAEGGYAIIAPTNGKVHPSGKPYVLVSGSLATIPTITPQEREELFTLARTFNELVEAPHEERRETQQPGTSGDRPGDRYNATTTWEEVLAPHGWTPVFERSGVTYWRRPGKERGVSATTDFHGSGLLYVFSTSTLFEAERGYGKFSAYALLNHNGDFAAAAKSLGQAGYTHQNPNGYHPPPETTWGDEATFDIPPPDHFRCTDLGNGERLIARHGENLRYCNQWKKFLTWDGRRWELDNRQTVRQWARKTVRGMYDETQRLTEQAKNAEEEKEKETLAKRATALLKHAVKSEAEGRLNAAISLAQMDCPVLPDELDTDPWLLNVLNGTLDLRTGLLRPHRRDDLLTKIIPFAYDQNAKCPQWESFLAAVMDGSEELFDFLQKAIGYSLTGNTKEDCLFLLYGSGANGKSTFQTILRTLGGDYGRQAEFSTFLHRDRDVVRNDLADLRGARLVTAGETDQDKRLSESVVKQLTGRDAVKARFLFQEYFEFMPQLKIWLAANHKPVIRGRDYAIWRRIRLVPFTQKFEGANKDGDLPDKLQTELPGILAWAVSGCLAWQQDGLPMPEAVQVATDAYKKEMDTIGNFLEECCEQKPHLRVKAGDLYNAYIKWSSDKLMTQTAFGKELTERGFETDRTSSGKWRVGIALVDTTES